MIKVGIVGFGYWGKNLVRNFNTIDNCDLVYVCEKNPVLAKKCAKLYPNINVVSDYNVLLNDECIEAVVIATPVDTHYPLSKAALETGKNVLVEKPLTSSVKEAEELLSIAKDKNLLLMVDHTFLYTGAVKYMKKKLDEDAIGDLQYIDSTRINLGLFQHDVNVLWDLAAHDISICLHLTGGKPDSVDAIGISHTPNDIENIAFLTLKFKNDLIAHFNCSWISPVKIRQMLIGGDEKMILYNDNEPTEKIKIYDTGFEAKTSEDRTRMLVDYRTGDIHVPKIQNTEALSLMAKDFCSCIETGATPVSDSVLGLNVVKILDAAQQSIKNNASEVLIK
jgi:predicted dehydrogenase